MKKRILSINKSINNKILSPTKNSLDRIIPINSTCHQAFCEIKAKRYRRESDLVFTTERDGFVSAWFIFSTFKKVLKKTGLGHARWHDLRHTFASILVQNGAPLYHVSSLLGHCSIKMTERYVHLQPTELTSVVSMLDRKNPCTI